MENITEPNVFINGKAQIIEMLQQMPLPEKEILLKNLKIRNPQLTEELIEKSFSVSHFESLSNHEINLVIQNVSAPVMGIALKGFSQDFQRKVLSIASRDYAENAYRILTTPTNNEAINMKRAQNKIKNIIIALSKQKQINI